MNPVDKSSMYAGRMQSAGTTAKRVKAQCPQPCKKSAAPGHRCPPAAAAAVHNHELMQTRYCFLACAAEHERNLIFFSSHTAFWFLLQQEQEAAHPWRLDIEARQYSLMALTRCECRFPRSRISLCCTVGAGGGAPAAAGDRGARAAGTAVHDVRRAPRGEPRPRRN